MASLSKLFTAAAVVTILGFSTSGCAPEPVAGDSTVTVPGIVPGQKPGAGTEVKPDDAVEKPAPPQNVDQNIPGRGPTEVPKSTVVPVGFANDILILDDSLSIFDVGSRGHQEWFIVYQLGAVAEAASIIEQLAESSNFDLLRTDLDDGHSLWNLAGDSAEITAVSFEDDQDRILLSIDITVY